MDNPADQSAAYPADFNGPAGRAGRIHGYQSPTNCTCRAGCTGAVYILIWGTIYGLILFADIPDIFTFIGAAIIIASGLYTVHRERLSQADELTEEKQKGN